MPRINIEDGIESNEEFDALYRILKDKDTCLGKLVRLFRLAQNCYADDKPITSDMLSFAGLEIMIETRWAIPFRDGFQVRDADKHFAWLIQKRKASIKGGEANSKKHKANKINTNSEPEESGRIAEKGRVDSPLALAPSLALSLSQKKAAKAACATAAEFPVLVEIWNTHCGVLAKVQTCSASRLKKIKERMKEFPSEAQWIEVVKAIAASDFCNARKDGNTWLADFDWLLKPDTFSRVLEGRYSNDRGKVQKQQEIHMSPIKQKLFEEGKIDKFGNIIPPKNELAARKNADTYEELHEQTIVDHELNAEAWDGLHDASEHRFDGES